MYPRRPEFIAARPPMYHPAMYPYAQRIVNPTCPIHGIRQAGKQQRGGAITSMTGAVTVGGLKSGTCNFANVKPRNENIATKLSELAKALMAEKKDGCYANYPHVITALHAAFTAINDASTKCLENPDSCGGTSRIGGGSKIKKPVRKQRK